MKQFIFLSLAILVALSALEVNADSFKNSMSVRELILAGEDRVLDTHRCPDFLKSHVGRHEVVTTVVEFAGKPATDEQKGPNISHADIWAVKDRLDITGMTITNAVGHRVFYIWQATKNEQEYILYIFSSGVGNQNLFAGRMIQDPNVLERYWVAAAGQEDLPLSTRQVWTFVPEDQVISMSIENSRGDEVAARMRRTIAFEPAPAHDPDPARDVDDSAQSQPAE